jgi:hypothetical protein
VSGALAAARRRLDIAVHLLGPGGMNKSSARERAGKLAPIGSAGTFVWRPADE